MSYFFLLIIQVLANSALAVLPDEVQVFRWEIVGGPKGAVTQLRLAKNESEDLSSSIGYVDRYNLSKRWIIKLQKSLNRLNYDSGEANGKIGERTRSAIRGFQRDHAMEADGNITRRLYRTVVSRKAMAPPAVNGGGTALLSKAEWKEAQRVLNKQGYKVGAVNGIPSKRMRRKMKRYARKNGITNAERDVFEHLKGRDQVSRKESGKAVKVPHSEISKTTTTRSDDEEPVVGLAAVRSDALQTSARLTVSKLHFECGEKGLGKQRSAEQKAQFSSCSDNRRAYQQQRRLFEILMKKYLPSEDKNSLAASQRQWRSDRQLACLTDSDCERAYSMNRASLLKQLMREAKKGRFSNAAIASIKKRASNSGRPNSDPIPGLWYGNLKCKRRGKLVINEIELRISSQDRANYALQLVVFVENRKRGHNRAAAAEYVGELVSPGNLQFVSVKARRSHTFGYYLSGFDFEIRTGRGRFRKGNCFEFEAVKQKPDSYRLLSTVIQHPGKGRYWDAADVRARCEVLTTWADKINKEYPVRKISEDHGGGVDWTVVKIFGDDDFVPIFGRVFDQLPLQRRQSIMSFGNVACKSGPFVNSRMKILQKAAGKILLGDPEGGRTSERYSSTVFAITKMRSIRHRLHEVSGGSYQFDSSKKTFKRFATELDELRRAIFVNADALWPSEKSNAIQIIDQLLAKAADAAQAASITKARNAKSVADGFELSYLDGKNGDRFLFLKYLKQSSDRDEFKLEMEKIHKTFADAATASIVKMAKSAPKSLVGVEQIENLSSVELPKIIPIGDAIFGSYNDKLLRERNSRLDLLVRRELCKLEALSPNRAGHTTSAAGIGGLTSAYRRCDKVPEGSKGLKTLADYRSKPDGYSSTVFAIKKTRSIRDRLREVSVGIYQFDPSKKTFKRLATELEELRRAISVNSDALWPSEKFKVLQIIDQLLVKAADAAQVASIAKARDAKSVADGFSFSYFDGKNDDQFPFLKYLKQSSDRDEFKLKMEKIHKTFADAATASIVKMAKSAPQSLVGVEQIENLSSAELPKIIPIGHALFGSYNDKLMLERNLRLRGLVKAELRKLEKFPPNRVGLAASAAWIDGFTSIFQRYDKLAEFSKGLKAFTEHRSKLLSAAIGEFELQLRELQDPDAAPQLLSQFLTWEGDHNLPIAFEYELLAVGGS